MGMALTPKFFGTVQFGKLEYEQPDLVYNYLLSLNGKVEIVIRKYHLKRTLKQSYYYWGIVIRIIADETGHSSDEIHELMKQMFLKDVIIIKGDKYETVRSTTDLDTMQFSQDYIKRIKQWAWSELNLIIPEPDNVEL